MVNVTNDSSKGTITLEIGNYFTIYNVNEIETIWKEQIAKKPKIIIIDCSHIISVDSPAIGILVKFKNEAMNNTIDLILDNVPMPLLNLFQSTNLIKFFSIKSTVGA